MAALEAVFMGMLLLSSVAIVASLQTPGPSITPSRAPMEASVADLLKVMHLLPTGDAFENELERSVGKSVVRNYTALERLIQQTLPVGAACRLWLDNGETDRLLYGPQTRPARESVSASRLYHPDWAYAFVQPSFDTVYHEATFGLQGYAVSQGSLVKEAGVPLDVELMTDLGMYKRGVVAAVKEGPSVSLAMRDEDGDLGLHYQDPIAPTINRTQVYHESVSGMPVGGNFTVPEGDLQRSLEINGTFGGTLALVTVTLTDPMDRAYEYVFTTLDVTTTFELPAPLDGNWTVAVSGTLQGTYLDPATSDLRINVLETTYNQDWQIVVSETANATLPVGTMLTLRVPDAMGGVDQTLTTQTGWSNITITEDSANGTIVQAKLSTTLTNTSRTFVLHAVRVATDAESMYVIRGEVTGAAEAQATFTIGRPLSVTSLDNPVRHGLYVSLPKPMAPGGSATMGFTFSYPATVTGLPETLTQLDVRTRSDTPLFASVTNGGGPGTWAVVSADHLQWTGAVSVSANAVQTLFANVTILATASPTEPGHKLPVEFATGSKLQMRDHPQPYVWDGWFPPHGGDPGFEVPTLTGTPAVGQATLGVEWYARANRVHGNATYNVTDFAQLNVLAESLRVGLARSHLNVSHHQVHIGQPFTVDVDFSKLLDRIDTTVAANPATLDVTDWEVHIRVLDPSQPMEDKSRRKAVYSAHFGGTGMGNNIVTNADSLDPIAGGWVPDTTNATSTTVGSFSFQPPQGSFFGPHAIIAEAKFTIVDVLSAETTVQVARLVSVVDVVPDFGQSETALYWLTLECWMPDW